MMSEKKAPGHRSVSSAAAGEKTIRVLLVDDEDRYRASLAGRLSMRGFEVQDVGDGEEAIRLTRQTRPDVVVLDRKMPGMQGEEVLREIKRISPVTQIVMLTGHASMESAAEAGRGDAFAYLEKPCETERLVSTIRAARQEKRYAMARLEIPTVEARSLWTWLKGTHNFRPGVMLLGVLLFSALVLAPAPAGLMSLLSMPKKVTAQVDPIAGYSKYSKMKPGETIAGYYSRTSGHNGGHTARAAPSVQASETALEARVMIGTLMVAALFWASGALPIGITALLVGVLMIAFSVFSPNLVAKAFAKDAVIFILGVLAMSAAVAKTGLDRRIGLLLLGTSRSVTAYLFIFLPLLAVAASFLSEHALVAFIAPLLMVVYRTAVREAGIKRDRNLVVLLMLAICFAANSGGPGSPAAGGRNAIMIGILSDYAIAPSFAQWVKYGLPFVPVMSLVIAGYFYLRFRGRLLVDKVNVASIIRKESDKLGCMTREEKITAGVLVAVIVMWITLSSRLGMGGPVLMGLVALAAFRIIGWRHINKISWDVVALYAGASAMGVGLAATGAALWIADSFTSTLPDFLSRGEGLAMASSLFTGVLTNFMSDGATVSALGPVAVPMATISGTHPWKVGFATAFSSSFANCFIIGTPNNAIAYSLARDADTGEQLLTLGDFLRHGVVVTSLAFVVLWGWAFFGYWKWIGF